MKSVYLAHHYMLLRYQSSRSEEDKTKLARAYFDQLAAEVDREMKGVVNGEGTTIIIAAGNR